MTRFTRKKNQQELVPYCPSTTKRHKVKPYMVISISFCALMIASEVIWYRLRHITAELHAQQQQQEQKHQQLVLQTSRRTLYFPMMVHRPSTPVQETPRNGLVDRSTLRESALHRKWDELDLISREIQNSYPKTTTATSSTSMVKFKPNDVGSSSSASMLLHPRIFYFDDNAALSSSSSSSSSFITSSTNNNTTSRYYTIMSNTFKSRLVEPIGNPCCETYHPASMDAFSTTCKPMMETKFHPTCNKLHEISMDNDISLLSTKGAWRSVWTIQQVLPSNQHHYPTIIALKMLSMKRRFNPKSFKAHHIDIMTMDALTASPNVANAYGFCGQSVMTEYATQSGRDFIKQTTMKTRTRVKIARDLARGLAELHAYKPLRQLTQPKQQQQQQQGETAQPIVKFAHNDINIANTIEVNGTLRWNDFNIGIILRTNGTMPCGNPVWFKGDLWRSPEEVRNTTYIHAEKSDVYSFGNILYQIMTRHQPWTHKEEGGPLEIEEVVERKLVGSLPAIPEQYYNSTKLETQVLLHSIYACYHPDPFKRPTAYELADMLGTAYDWLKNRKASLKRIRTLFVNNMKQKYKESFK